MWICMIVKNRLEFTVKSLEALIAAQGHYKIMVIDNGSDEKTLRYLYHKFEKGNIDRLLFNKDVPQWQKSYAITQAVKMLEMEEYEYFAWIDNDVVVEPHWDEVAVELLKVGYQVSSFCCDNTQKRFHGDGIEKEHNKIKFNERDTANGALWLVRKNFFSIYGTPPICKGINRQGSEDWFYVDEFKRRKIYGGFATFNTYARHIGASDSEKGRVLRNG